jgi:hypothetical protein
VALDRVAGEVREGKGSKICGMAVTDLQSSLKKSAGVAHQVLFMSNFEDVLFSRTVHRPRRNAPTYLPSLLDLQAQHFQWCVPELKKIRLGFGVCCERDSRSPMFFSVRRSGWYTYRRCLLGYSVHTAILIAL